MEERKTIGSYEFSGYRIDSGERLLRRGADAVYLQPKVVDLLLVLLESGGRVVTKDELMERVWAGAFVEESNLTHNIAALRRVLGEKNNGAKFIETVPRRGYRFVADVTTPNGNGIDIITLERSVAHIISEREIETADEVVPSLRTGKPSARTSAAVIALGGIFLVAFFGLIGFWFFNRNQNNGANAPVTAAEKQTNIKRLTSKGNANHAVLSPDGKFFAYTLQERGKYQSSLWLGQTNGNSDVQLFPAGDFVYYPRSFSADGNYLYYTVNEPRDFDNGTLYKMPILGSVPQKLVQGISVFAAISPDEKQIAFVRRKGEDKTSALVVANTDGANEREIAVRPVGQSFLGNALSWSADGALVGFAADVGKSQEIFSANVVSGEVKQITSSEWAAVSSTGWLSDGSGLIAVAREKNSWAANQLWRIDYETGKARNINRDLLHYGSTLSLSADSNMLVALQAVQGGDIWIAPAENLAEARRITFGSSGHEGWLGVDWTADGKIIYTARVDQSVTIWTMDTLGANAKQITSAGFLDERPSATVDGKFIVFQSNRSGATEIWRMNADGAEMRQLTTGGGEVPHVTPDGEAVVFSRESDGVNSIWRISIEGGEAVRITDKQSSNPRVSPDGNFIACGWVDNGKTKLAILSVTGDAPTKLFDVPTTYNFTGSIRWTRDGRFISYRDWSHGVWSQSIHGGEPVRLEGLPTEKLSHYEWSPDAKQFAYSIQRVVRDAVLFTDFK